VSEAAAAGRKALCTIAHGRHRELYDVARPTFERYADVHGYDLHVVEHRMAPQRPGSWGKVPLLHRLVQHYDVVLWVDADAIFVDSSCDVVRAMRPGRFMHLVAHRFDHEHVFNCGVIAMRGGAVSRRFLERVWNQIDLVHHEWWENAAVLRLLGYRLERPVRRARLSPWRAGVGRLDRAWNSIPEDPSPHPIVAHFPGVSHDERLAMMRAVAG
jgi:hypothetical protein